MINITQLFCEHDYTLIDKLDIKSEYDIVVDSGRTPNSHISITRKYVSTFKCNKCKKIKRLIEKTERK